MTTGAVLAAVLASAFGAAPPDAQASETAPPQGASAAGQPTPPTPPVVPGYAELSPIERAKWAADITEMTGVPTLVTSGSRNISLDFTRPQPVPWGFGPYDPVFGDPLEPIAQPLRDLEAWMENQLGIQTNLYYTIAFQAATFTQQRPDGQGPYGHAWAVGRMDWNLNWNVFDDPDFGHGQVGFLMRSGVVIGQPTDYNMTTAVGSLVGVNSLYQTSAATLNLLYWQQGFFDDRLVFTAGRIHPNQYIMLNRVANDEASQFLGGPMDGIDTFQGGLGTYAPGVVVQAIPCEWFYVNALAIDILDGPEKGFGSIGRGVYWMAVEGGLVTHFGDLAGQLGVAYMHTNAGPSTTGRDNTVNGSGVAALFQQEVYPNVIGYVEYGWTQPQVTTVTKELSTGLGILNPFGRKEDMFGVALAWSQPSDSSQRENVLIETFYRLQITNSCQLSPDLQILAQPSFGENHPSVIFGLRLKTQF